MARRSTSVDGETVLVMICGAKYDPSDDDELGGQGMKGGDSMPT